VFHGIFLHTVPTRSRKKIATIMASRTREFFSNQVDRSLPHHFLPTSHASLMLAISSPQPTVPPPLDAAFASSDPATCHHLSLQLASITRDRVAAHRRRWSAVSPTPPRPGSTPARRSTLLSMRSRRRPGMPRWRHRIRLTRERRAAPLSTLSSRSRGVLRPPIRSQGEPLRQR
jgi:hypothetical protein